MKLIRDDAPVCDFIPELASLFWNQNVVALYVIDTDGYYMAMAVTRAALADPNGRKAIAADLRELRKQIRATRGTRERPSP